MELVYHRSDSFAEHRICIRSLKQKLLSSMVWKMPSSTQPALTQTEESSSNLQVSMSALSNISLRERPTIDSTITKFHRYFCSILRIGGGGGGMDL
ncbi:hypothetical protein OESDEN_16927 [Oesophagostomum dentatum]|uniref:Uncharacterized protein n=1 Tax=Oesophagostomum dentatum TaxID=61180 RepID=A0A0B1SHJ7_OESDE|nr:hypothetical protein OESDEN_16927 [Oesophagostomum dentatum]